MGQRYRRMKNQKPRHGLARNQDCAKGGGFELLNQNLKSFQKCLNRGRGEQTRVTQTYHSRRSGINAEHKPQPFLLFVF